MANCNCAFRGESTKAQGGPPSRSASAHVAHGQRARCASACCRPGRRADEAGGSCGLVEGQDVEGGAAARRWEVAARQSSWKCLPRTGRAVAAGIPKHRIPETGERADGGP